MSEQQRSEIVPPGLVRSHTFRPSSSAARALALSLDGSRLALGSEDGAIRIWDLNSDDTVPEVRIPPPNINCLAWAPSGQTLAVGCHTSAVCVYNLQQSDVALRNCRDHYKPVRCLTWSFDGRILASAFADGTILLSGTDDQRLGNLDSEGDPVLSVAWAPNEWTIAVSSADGRLKLFSGLSFRGPMKCSEHRLADSRQTTNPAYIGMSVSWSPDGNGLAAGCSDRVVRVFDPRGRKLASSFEGHTGAVRSLAYASDGRLLASGGDDGTVRLWRVDDGAGGCRTQHKMRTLDPCHQS